MQSVFAMWILYAMARLATQCVSVGDGAAVESRSGSEAFVALMKPADLHQSAVNVLYALWTSSKCTHTYATCVWRIADSGEISNSPHTPSCGANERRRVLFVSSVANGGGDMSPSRHRLSRPRPARLQG